MDLQLVTLDKTQYKQAEPGLDQLFKPEGEYIAVPAAELSKIDPMMLRLYLHFNAIYGIVTIELVEWLKKNLDLSNAIEIGSGTGILGRALGIRCTDNYLQQRPDIAINYLMTGQPIIKYGKHVENIDGLEAIKKYKPTTVIASWFTHKWKDGEDHLQGNYWAPDELEIMKHTDTYCMIGCHSVHGPNRLFKSAQVEEHYFEGLHSRHKPTEENRVFIFT